jgi:hypothetical protein
MDEVICVSVPGVRRRYHEPETLHICVHHVSEVIMATTSRSQKGRGGARRRATAGKRTIAPARGTVISRPPEIDLDTRHRLAECCAFFEAEQYREAEPGKIRSTDIAKIEAEIDGMIEKCARVGQRSR